MSVRSQKTRIKLTGDFEPVEKTLAKIIEVLDCLPSPILSSDTGGCHVFLTILGVKSE